MPVRGRKSSASVRLAFMGAAATAIAATPGCGEDVQRNRYASLSDCVADYSDAQCRPDFPIDSGYRTGTSTSYYGPWYRGGSRGPTADDPGPGRTYLSGHRAGFSSSGSASHGPAGVEGGHRGGFGSHGVSSRS